MRSTDARIVLSEQVTVGSTPLLNLKIQGGLLGLVVDKNEVTEGNPVDTVVQELHRLVAKHEVSATWMPA